MCVGRKYNRDLPICAVDQCPIKICWWHRISVYNGYIRGICVLWCGRNLAQQMISRGQIVKWSWSIELIPYTFYLKWYFMVLFGIFKL